MVRAMKVFIVKECGGRLVGGRDWSVRRGSRVSRGEKRVVEVEDDHGGYLYTGL
jgi:hypothetical protein